jgi:predicted acylesterase/phospholipase RssA
MVIVAVDANTGELAAFDRGSDVDLVDAVTASTALPGLVPTAGINGARYIDGGVRSPENADLASGYARERQPGDASRISVPRRGRGERTLAFRPSRCMALDGRRHA